MSWLEDLQTHAGQYSEIIETINAAFAELKAEAAAAPYQYELDYSLSSEESLTWNVKIKVPPMGNVDFQVTKDDLVQGVFSGRDYVRTGLPEPLAPKLGELIVKKMKEQASL